MVLTIRAREAERCALCHDALEGRHEECVVCGTRAHRSCRSELARRCPTLGCTGRLTPRARDEVVPFETRPPGSDARRCAAFWRGFLFGLILSLAGIGLAVITFTIG